MKATTFVVSEGASVDKRSNMLSIFSIIREMKAPTLPMVIPRMTVVAVLEREENESEEPGITLRGKQGKERLFDFPVKTQFGGKKLVTRLIVDIRSIRVTQAEPLVLQLIWGGRQRATYQVLIQAEASVESS